MQKIIHGDCLDVMRTMDDNYIDFIVCDPPYGLNFMGKDWDGCIPAIEIWAEALRICKPGAMVAAFGGSRTHHHLMLAIEGSGWEIRDVIMWITGQGFPKSHNFGKKMGEEWKGFGTALKPAYEPIILAMKPLDGTFAQNAENWGVGGINIDESRIGTGGTKRSHQAEYPKNEDGTEDRSKHWARTGHSIESNGLGRWPSNLILNEESAEQLDQMTGNNVSRFFYCAKASRSERNAGLEGMPLKEACHRMNDSLVRMESGCATGKRAEQSKNQNTHPTVKPIALMKYILKLLAPPGNPICLDPFCGSGSTLIAAKELGISCIGIEKEEEYVEIARKRSENWPIKEDNQMEMFNET